ncbi:MAG: aminoglycoside phosphotransferase family protein [Hyphomicrobiales bacterium]|nr:aminoglycoside phosphotransferase family protein [Hyphomicrobiales bacterium]
MSDLQMIGKGRLAEVFTWDDNRVLKLFTAGRDPATIETEARVSAIVHDAGIATPGVHGLVERDGRHGIVFDRVDGTSMLRLLSTRPWMIPAYGRRLAALHASIHRCQSGALPSQLEQLENLIDRADAPTAERDQARIRLREMPGGTAICHGDFHPDNVLIDGDKATIIDWTTACVGNPVADFVRTSLILQLGAPPPGASAWNRAIIGVGRALFHRSYGRRYQRLRHLHPQDIQPWIHPLAVSRLGANIATERDQLLALIDQTAN